jgi:hypothetical protein
MKLYEAVVLDGVPEPDLPGHVKAQIPELYADAEYPYLIPPLYPGPSLGGWQSVPSAGEGIAVIDLGGGSFRWIGTLDTAAAIGANPAGRVGARSKDGRHSIIIDDTYGVQFAVQDDAADEMQFVRIDPDGTIQINTALGHTFLMQTDDELVHLQTPGGNILQMSTDGIMMVHSDGVASMELKSGDIATLGGTVVQISGGSIELGDGSIPPTNPYILSLSFMADLALLCADVIAIGAAIPTMSPYVATNAASMSGKIGSSLGAGAPYLSTRIYGD